MTDPIRRAAEEVSLLWLDVDAIEAIIRKHMPANQDELETQLACACDLVNSWCREYGLKECCSPYKNLALREAIDRLWGKMSGMIHGTLPQWNDKPTCVGRWVSDGGLVVYCRDDRDCEFYGSLG